MISEGMNAPTIWRRIAGYRRDAGFRTAQDLADAIPNPKITGPVIQNIESGRKADITVGQLLDIARGLGIPPLFLLIRVGDPEGTVDLPNLGEAVSSMSIAEFDPWFSLYSADSAVVREGLAAEIYETLTDTRYLRNLVNRRVGARHRLAVHHSLNPDETHDYERMQYELSLVDKDVEMLAKRLQDKGVDVTWIDG